MIVEFLRFLNCTLHHAEFEINKTILTCLNLSLELYATNLRTDVWICRSFRKAVLFKYLVWRIINLKIGHRKKRYSSAPPGKAITVLTGCSWSHRTARDLKHWSCTKRFTEVFRRTVTKSPTIKSDVNSVHGNDTKAAWHRKYTSMTLKRIKMSISPMLRERTVSPCG